VAFLDLASGSGVLAGRVLENHWREVSPAPSGGVVEATFTVTRCRRLPAGGAGAVGWHAEVRDEQGRVIQEGTITVQVPARSGTDGSGDPVDRAFCTRPWADALARRLADDPGFTAATATWDGTIGLRAGGNQVQLRVYRGRVIEVAPRTPQGATFTLEADDHVWTDLLTGPSNDFFRRAMSGDSFTVSGSAYEYLRLSRAVMTLIDAARALATGAAA
jgi:putative sterol carrier protein